MPILKSLNLVKVTQRLHIFQYTPNTQNTNNLAVHPVKLRVKRVVFSQRLCDRTCFITLTHTLNQTYDDYQESRMDRPIQTYTSIIDAVRGHRGHEIESTTPPIPIDPLQAESLSAYISSFLVPTYRMQWAEIDDATAPPKPSTYEDASVPAMYEEALPLEVIEEKWDIRIWAKPTVNGAEAPMFGFTMKPRITILTLYIYVWLLLPTTERGNDWVIYHRSSDSLPGRPLDWRSNANNPVEDGDYIILGPNKSEWKVVPIIDTCSSDRSAWRDGHALFSKEGGRKEIGLH